MKSFDEIIDSFGATGFKNKAVEKTDVLTKEIKNLMGNFKNLDLNNLTDHPVIENIKDNVTDVVNLVQDMEVLEFAKGKIHDTKNQFFTLLNIPSQVDVDNINRKLSTLERKIKAINKPKTRTRR